MAAGSDKRYLLDKMSGICLKRAYTISRLINDMLKNVVLRNMRPCCPHLTLRMGAAYPSYTFGYLPIELHCLSFCRTAVKMVIQLTEQACRTHESGPLPSVLEFPQFTLQTSRHYRGKIFFLASKTSRLVLGPTQPLIECQGFRGYSDRGVTLTTHLHLVPWLKGDIHSQLN